MLTVIDYDTATHVKLEQTSTDRYPHPLTLVPCHNLDHHKNLTTNQSYHRPTSHPTKNSSKSVPKFLGTFADRRTYAKTLRPSCSIDNKHRQHRE